MVAMTFTLWNLQCTLTTWLNHGGDMNATCIAIFGDGRARYHLMHVDEAIHAWIEGYFET